MQLGKKEATPYHGLHGQTRTDLSPPIQSPLHTLSSTPALRLPQKLHTNIILFTLLLHSQSSVKWLPRLKEHHQPVQAFSSLFYKVLVSRSAGLLHYPHTIARAGTIHLLGTSSRPGRGSSEKHLYGAFYNQVARLRGQRSWLQSLRAGGQEAKAKPPFSPEAWLKG